MAECRGREMGDEARQIDRAGLTGQLNSLDLRTRLREQI